MEKFKNVVSFYILIMSKVPITLRLNKELVDDINEKYDKLDIISQKFLGYNKLFSKSQFIETVISRELSKL